MFNLDGPCQTVVTAHHYDIEDGNFPLLLSYRWIALHEMGHVFGLDHYNGYRNGAGTYFAFPETMVDGGLGSTGDTGFLTRKYFLTERTMAAVRSKYPDSQNLGHDLVAQSYWGNSAYHEVIAQIDPTCFYAYFKGRPRPHPAVDLLTRAVDEGKPYGKCPSVMDTLPLPALPITVGSQFAVAFTVHNNGNAYVPNVPFRYRLTTDPLSSSGGFILHTGTLSMSPDVPFQMQQVLTIPYVGQGVTLWYLVLEVDYTNVVLERLENNNKAVWNRRLQVFP